MSLHTSSKGGPGRVRILLTLMLAVLGMSACSAGDLFTPNHTGAANLALRPVFSSVASSSMSSLDINFIRLTIKQLPNGPTTVQDTTVDPNSDSWSLPITAPFNAELEVTIELINKTGGTEVTVFSGQVEVKVPANSQQQPPPTPVPVFPGSPANLGIQKVTIVPRDQSVLEGGTVQLSATVAPATITNPTITWESANPTIATVDPSTGLVTAKLPGQATIRAHAGPQIDEIAVTVGPRATKIELTPTSATIPSLGASASFTAKVEDARGAVVPGINATLAIGDATIASQTSPGVFKALKNGTTTVTATATQAGQLIIGTATLKVEQKAVTVTITPTTASFGAFGRTATFKASAKDANNNDVTGLTFTWSSSDNTVATVDANGVVTSRGNGKATIKADLAGVSATAEVTVQQAPASLTVTPSEATLKSLGETTTLTGQVKDSAGNVMNNVAITWLSALPTIATIDANGVVTAQGDGTVAILASAGSQHASATIYVDRVVAGVTMSATHVDMNAGTTKQLSATAVDAKGSPMKDALTWTSTKSSVATVSSTGLVTAISAGDAEIRAATANGAMGATTVKVTGSSAGVPLGSGQVLVLSNTSYDNSTIIGRLQPLMPGVTFVNLTANSSNAATLLTPTYLAQFRVVLLFENGIFSGPHEIGNAIANYVNSGGNVVLGTFYWQDRSDNLYYGSYTVHGWGALEAVDPFQSTATSGSDQYTRFEYRSATLDAASIVAHPLTAGVHSMVVSNYPNGMGAKPGTTVVASYTNGSPMIGYVSLPGGQRIVAVAMWPGDYSVTGDFNTVWVNALTWAGSGSVATAASPTSSFETYIRPYIRSESAPTDALPSGAAGGSPRGKSTAGEDK